MRETMCETRDVMCDMLIDVENKLVQRERGMMSDIKAEIAQQQEDMQVQMSEMQDQLVQREVEMHALIAEREAHVEAREEIRLSELENQLSLFRAESSSSKMASLVGKPLSDFVGVECMQCGDDDMMVRSSDRQRTHMPPVT